MIYTLRNYPIDGDLGRLGIPNEVSFLYIRNEKQYHDGSVLSLSVRFNGYSYVLYIGDLFVH